MRTAVALLGILAGAAAAEEEPTSAQAADRVVAALDDGDALEALAARTGWRTGVRAALDRGARSARPVQDSGWRR